MQSSPFFPSMFIWSMLHKQTHGCEVRSQVKVRDLEPKNKNHVDNHVERALDKSCQFTKLDLL